MRHPVRVSDLRWAFTRVRIRFSDLLDRLRVVGPTALRERRIQVILVATAALVVSNIIVVRTTDTTVVQQFSATSVTLLVTFLSVYLSFDVVAPYLKFTERQRIGRARDVVDAYDESVFIDLDKALPSSIDGGEEYSPVAAAIESTPDALRPLDRLRYDYRDEMYEIPADLWGVLEPATERMNQLFEREGCFSELKIRLDGVTDSRFRFSKTTYYRSFLTNFCPDLNVGSGRTPRILTKSQLVDDGAVMPLSATPFSNHLGAAGLVVTADGVTAVSTRSSRVAVDKYAKSLSFSGALSLAPAREGRSFAEIVLTEMTEELNIPASAVRGTAYLGTTRRMERLGKPDVVALVLVDEIDCWENPTEEFTGLDVIDLEGVSDVESVADLFTADVAETLLESLFDNLDTTTRHASIGLLSFIALYSRLVRMQQRDRPAR
jgi:hypothetical protein